jgi:serine/threonine-protein kinase ULK/ATG1
MKNFIFKRNGIIDILVIDQKKTIEDLIKEYLKKIKKDNLNINNLEMIYFTYNGHKLEFENNKQIIEDFFLNDFNDIRVCRLNSYSNLEDFEIVETIKDNVYTTVYKAKLIRGGDNKYVAIKKIKKEKLKDDIKEDKCIDVLTEEDFKEEIIKFNRELEMMIECECENSVEIYDYFDTEKEFIIIMELCDNNLFRELAKTNNGFNIEQIKDILLQLNNVFKIMYEKNIAHRDIKLHNILVKYLNEEHTKFKVLLSDYGVSNQLNSMTGRFKTFAGSQIIMAPEILEGEEYNNKCDLWSLGVNIYQLYTKKPPYNGKFDKVILNQITKLGNTVLDVIEDATFKDLLSKLLVKDPEKRISWEEYFEHDFFK